jgi:hypothetical protein
MGCRDNSLSYLRSLGYNVVRLPKSDISPLLMLARDGRVLDRFGALDSVLVGDGTVPLPPIAIDLPAANITGRSSSTVKLGLGLSVLGNIIAAMGGSSLGLETAYRRASSVSFEFRDVLEDRVEVAALDRYLSSADLNSHTTHAGRMLESDDLFVITSVLKTDKIAVRARDAADVAVSLEVPLVQEIVGGTVSVSAVGGHSDLLTYAGPGRLVFGFQAVRLHYDHGVYRAIVPATDVSMREPLDDGFEHRPAYPSDDGAERFVASAALVRLRDA